MTASITRVERQRAEELAHDDLEVGERRGEQQLDRARALFLGVGAHRDHRHHEQQHDRDVREHRTDHPSLMFIDAAAAAHLAHLHALPHEVAAG